MRSRPPLRDEPDLDLLEYVLISAPRVDALGPVASAAADLVGCGSIRVLDGVVLLRRGGRPQVAVADVAEHAALAPLAPLVLGTVLLSPHDVELAAVTLPPDVAALLLLLEHRWAGALSAAARESGGRLDAGERIGRERVIDALTAPGVSRATERAGRADLLVRGPANTPTIDRVAQVRELARLVDRGVLSLDRYEVQRRRTLDS